MEDNQLLVSNSNVNPPAVLLKQDRLYRVGKIFLNIAMTLLCLTLLGLISIVLSPVLYLFALAAIFVLIAVIVIFTLGTVFTMENNPIPKLWDFLESILDKGDALMEITAFCFNLTKWLSIAGMALAVLSLIFIAITKKRRKTLKIVFLCIAIAILAFVCVFQFTTGGFQWQG